METRPLTCGTDTTMDRPVMNDMPSELQRLRQRWDLAVESAGFGVWDLDVKNELVHYSPQWTAALGYGDSDVPEHTSTWRNRVHPDDLQPMLDALGAHLVDLDPSYETEFRLRAADGMYRWVLSRGRVVERDESGSALRAIGTLTDLTDRRRSDRRLSERHLQHAARHASFEMLGRMSHEMRTPLNAVLGFAQLLSHCIGHADVDQQRRYATHINDAGWRLLQMVDDLMDLSQLEQGRLGVRLQSVALSDVIDAAMKATAPLAKQHAVQLTPRQLPTQATVRADESRLWQVLVGLISNGIKYNRVGGTVTVDVSRPDHGTWRIAVTDTGVGIAEEERCRLFEPFYRNGRHPSGVEGLGLGLSLARSLLDIMGGRLEVDSVSGQGSTFAVSLPAVDPGRPSHDPA